MGDFNADGRSDPLWQHADGQLEIWFAGEYGNSAKVSRLNSTDANGAPVGVPDTVQDWRIQGVGDFDGDGYSDIYWKHQDGRLSIWYMKHAMHVGEVYPDAVAGGYEVDGIGDFDADGRSDILWRHTGGTLSMWFGGQLPGYAAPAWLPAPEWEIAAIADLSADGCADIVWRHTNGSIRIWRMFGGTLVGESPLLPMANTWQLRGALAQGPRWTDRF